MTDDLLALMPFATALGIELDAAAADEVRGRLAWAPERCTAGGLLHGGALMALADNLGGTAAVANLAPGQITATIESKTNFFAAVPKGDIARAVCMPLHRGRTTIVLETRITRGDGKLAAIVTQTQLIFDGQE
jgi:1,4-dihydroxy-2-naphthoyl-CoA hydrolase